MGFSGGFHCITPPKSLSEDAFGKRRRMNVTIESRERRQARRQRVVILALSFRETKLREKDDCFKEIKFVGMRFVLCVIKGFIVIISGNNQLNILHLKLEISSELKKGNINFNVFSNTDKLYQLILHVKKIFSGLVANIF